MRHQYSPTDTDLETFDKIRSRKQRPGESFAKFSVAISLLASRLRNPLSEPERLEHLRANMSVGLKNALLFHPTRSVHELQELAKRFEKLASLQSDRAPQLSRRISEIDSNPYIDQYSQDRFPVPTTDTNLAEQYTIEAVSKPSAPIPNRVDFLICWNCDDMGHTYADCVVSTRNVFCYGCGAKNTYKPSCAKCTPGNLRKDGTSQPPSRPTQILTRAPNPFARR